MRRFALGLATATLVPAIVLGATRPLRAQALEAPRARQGYYLALGGHFALNQNWENRRDWGVWPGYDVTFRVGQLLTRRFGLGLAVHYGGAGGQGQRAGLFGLTAEVQGEIARHLTLRAGVGVDSISLATVGATGEAARGTAGSGYVLGLAYDWFLTRRVSGGWALTPVVQLRLIPGKTDALVGTIGVELTYWTGLPRNQLDLPASEAFGRHN